jgi:hypothetical protein
MARTILLVLVGALVLAVVGGAEAQAVPIGPSIICEDEECNPPPPPPPPPPQPDPSPANPYWYPDGWYYESSGAGSGLALLSTSAAGCDTRVVTKTARSVLFRSVIFRLHLRVNWCWRYPNITSLAVNCWVSDVDRFTITYTECKLNGWYFSWGGSLKGGRYQQGQSTFSNCVIRYGCWRNDLVTLKFWGYANGAWRAET